MAEVRDGVKSEAHSWPTSQALVLTRDPIILDLGGLLNSLISTSLQPLSLFIMLSRLSLTKLGVSHFPWARNSLWPIRNSSGWCLYTQALVTVHVWDTLSSVSPFPSCSYPLTQIHFLWRKTQPSLSQSGPPTWLSSMAVLDSSPTPVQPSASWVDIWDLGSGRVKTRLCIWKDPFSAGDADACVTRHFLCYIGV